MDEEAKKQQFDDAIKFARVLLMYEQVEASKPEVLSSYLFHLIINPSNDSIIYKRYYAVLDKAISGCELSHRALGQLYKRCITFNEEIPTNLDTYIADEANTPRVKRMPKGYGRIAADFHKSRIIRMVIHQLIKRTALDGSRNIETIKKFSACDVMVCLHVEFFGKAVTYRTILDIWQARKQSDSFELWKKLGFEFEPVEDDPRWRDRFILREETYHSVPPGAPSII